jgi:hypothetical protein
MINDTNSYDDSWIKHFWRPAMAWQYLTVCLFDFIVFPLLTMAYFYVTKLQYVPWDPLTLKLSGFYHIAMAAIVGVSAYTRGQEKIQNIVNTAGSDDPIVPKSEK